LTEIKTNLGKLRLQRRISAIQLASVVGISRQTVYAMEAGTYVPNTAVALRLARALDSSVEDLFTLLDQNSQNKARHDSALLLPGSDTLAPGQGVQLCQVDKRLVASAPSPVPWFFPLADAVVTDKPPRQGKTGIQIFHSDCVFSGRILVAGCDPAISVLSRYALSAGVELVLAHRNSTQALALLKQGCIHVAGTHLSHDPSGESNLLEINRLFPKNSVAVITFAVWEQGIITARNNPKIIRGIEDFARKDVVIVNREPGAGARTLLDSSLKKLRMETSKVRGYGKFASGHLSAAWQVQSGVADCCLSTRAAARALGLHFIPLLSERYDLVIRRPHLDLPRIQNLLDTLSRSDFRRELEGLGGYDTKVTGQRLL
jgi:putative molybdopterin biosynthesis protein